MASRAKTRRLTLMAVLLAAAITLSWAESLLPPLSGVVPGIKLGLSNIVTMYCLIILGYGYGLEIAVLKSIFVFLIRGVTASVLSLAGGILSVSIMFLVSRIKGLENSYIILGIFGAVSHNVAQILAAVFIMQFGSVNLTQNFLMYYLPVLIISGTIMGVVTGLTLRAVMPYINKLSKFEHGGK